MLKARVRSGACHRQTGVPLRLLLSIASYAAAGIAKMKSPVNVFVAMLRSGRRLVARPRAAGGRRKRQETTGLARDRITLSVTLCLRLQLESQFWHALANDQMVSHPRAKSLRQDASL